MKGTQRDDTEAYENVKNEIEKILSHMNRSDDERKEAMRRVLAASFMHQKDFVCGSCMTSYLIRNNVRFHFSHNFVWCPLGNIRQLLEGEPVQATVTFSENKANLHCTALNYLCRPESLSFLNAFDFYKKYETVNINKTTIRQGALSFSTIRRFKHPSFICVTGSCKKGVKLRKQPFLIKIDQRHFQDSASFGANILLDETEITDSMETYSQNALLLFLSYRDIDDLRKNNSYTLKLREAVLNNSISTQNQAFLQNIQDCKANSHRCKIDNEDLDRATEAFCSPIDINDEHNITDPENANNEISQFNVIDLFDIIQGDNQEPNDTFDLRSSNTQINLAILRQKGTNTCGINCLPSLEYDYSSSHLQSLNIVDEQHMYVNNNIHGLPRPTPIEISKCNIMELFVDCNYLTEKTFENITKSNRRVQVLAANGSAQSIIDWAVKCGLDNDQKRAFEIITGYYILSFIYAASILNSDSLDDAYQHEINKLEHLVGKSKINNDQLICFLHGPGGSGKSTIISLLSCYSNEYHTLLKTDNNHRSIVITAMTGVAATLIGGETTHSALHLNKETDNISLDQIELLANTKILIIDEISFATPLNIYQIDTNLRKLKDKADKTYGGVHIIFCGDLRQLEPVKGVPLYNKNALYATIFPQHLNCYIKLSGMHRYQQDPEWGELLLRFRNGYPRKSDIESINSRVKTNKDVIPAEIKYVTYSNNDRDAINTAIFCKKAKFHQTHYANTNPYIMIFCDNIEYKKHDQYIPLIHKKLFYETCGESDIETNRQGRIDPVLKLYIGCNIMLTQNIDVCNGLANGTQATIHRVVFKSNNDISTITLDNDTKIRAAFASDIDYILCKHCNPNITEQIFKMIPKQTSFRATIKLPKYLQIHNQNIEQVYSMRAIQIPIISNAATTGHKLQGSSIDQLFVSTWIYQKNWAYVVLSRVKTKSGLYLRKGIDKDLNKYRVPTDLTDMIEDLQKHKPATIDYTGLIQ